MHLISTEALQLLMGHARLSVRDLAHAAGVSPALVGHLRSGKRRTCTRESASRISGALRVPVSALFEPKQSASALRRELAIAYSERMQDRGGSYPRRTASHDLAGQDADALSQSPFLDIWPQALTLVDRLCRLRVRVSVLVGTVVCRACSTQQRRVVALDAAAPLGGAIRLTVTNRIARAYASVLLASQHIPTSMADPLCSRCRSLFAPEDLTSVLEQPGALTIACWSDRPAIELTAIRGWTELGQAASA